MDLYRSHDRTRVLVSVTGNFSIITIGFSVLCNIISSAPSVVAALIMMIVISTWSYMRLRSLKWQMDHIFHSIVNLDSAFVEYFVDWSRTEREELVGYGFWAFKDYVLHVSIFLIAAGYSAWKILG